MALSQHIKEKLAHAFRNEKSLPRLPCGCIDMPTGHFHDAVGRKVDRLGRRVISRVEIDLQIHKVLGIKHSK